MIGNPSTRIRKWTSRASFLLIATLLLAMASAPAAADIYRGCHASLGFVVVSGINMDTSRSSSKTLDEFEGRGACANRLQANTCRSRAKDNVFRCANDFWARRWNLIGDPSDDHPDEGLPSSCLGRATGAKGLGPFRTNPYGQSFDIKYAMEYAACCEMQPRAKSMQLALFVSTVGDKGCGNDKAYGAYREQRQLEGRYMVDCERARGRGMCGVRTNGE